MKNWFRPGPKQHSDPEPEPEPFNFPWNRVRMIRIDGIPTWVVAPVMIEVPASFFQKQNHAGLGPRPEEP